MSAAKKINIPKKPILEMIPQTFSRDEVCNIFKISSRTLRDWVEQNKIDCLCDWDSRERRRNVSFLKEHIIKRLIEMGMDPGQYV